MTNETPNNDGDDREPYEPPAITDLGSLAELTQGEPGITVSDSLELGGSI